MKVTSRLLEEFVRAGREPADVMEAFRDWVSRVSKGTMPVFVGFNAMFDWSFINWYFHTYLGDNPFGLGGLDIKSYYMGLVGCPWAETRSSRIPEKFKSKTYIPITHLMMQESMLKCSSECMKSFVLII
jgi:ribonuclease T